MTYKLFEIVYVTYNLLLGHFTERELASVFWWVIYSLTD